MLQLLPFETQQPLRGLLYTLLRLPDLVLYTNAVRCRWNPVPLCRYAFRRQPAGA